MSARLHANEVRPKMAATQLNQRQTLDVQPAMENSEAIVEKDTCISFTTLLCPTYYNSTTVWAYNTLTSLCVYVYVLAVAKRRAVSRQP